jgi:hypothetical protein
MALAVRCAVIAVGRRILLSLRLRPLVRGAVPSRERHDQGRGGGVLRRLVRQLAWRPVGGACVVETPAKAAFVRIRTSTKAQDRPADGPRRRAVHIQVAHHMSLPCDDVRPAPGTRSDGPCLPGRQIASYDCWSEPTLTPISLGADRVSQDGGVRVMESPLARKLALFVSLDSLNSRSLKPSSARLAFLGAGTKLALDGQQGQKAFILAFG